jgi:F-type H+-transporting ATPase subunit b
MIKRMVLALALMMWVVAPTVRAADAAHGGEQAAAPAVDAHGAADTAHGEGQPGHGALPLLPDPTSRSDQLQALWVVIIFVALLAILYPTAWKNVLAGLKARESKIRQDIADAEAARKRAEETLGKYNQQLATAENQVRELLAKAGADAEKLATGMKMTAQQEVEEIKERATRDIEAARKAAVADVHAQAAELSTLIASKILRRNLNADDQRDLVKSSLEQLQTVGKA